MQGIGIDYGFINMRSILLGLSETLNIYRCGRITETTDAGLEYLKEKLAVKLVINMQTKHEFMLRGESFASKGIDYYNIPICSPRIEVLFPNDQVYLENYKALVCDNQAGIASVMRILAECPFDLAVISCGMGKDRTGIVAALLMKLAGRIETEIMEDYSLSGAEIRKVSHLFEEHWIKRGISESDYLKRLDISPSVILCLLEYIDKCYGGIERYLIGGGLGMEHIKILKERIK